MESAIKNTVGTGIAHEAIRVYEQVKGLPYIYGGKTPKGFDCSGFVAHVLGNLFPHHKQRFQTSVEGYIKHSLFVRVDIHQIGDLIVFPANSKGVNHIGIVVNDTHWIGSQSSTGVAPVKLKGSWWEKNRPCYFLRIKIESAAAIVSSFKGTPNVALT